MILVFGSINIDVVVPVPHLPAAGETVLGGDYALLPGGKGANQALAARRAGATVAMAGAVGTDGFAMIALAGLEHAGVDLRLVSRVNRPTGCAAIMVGEAGENIIAVASGANHAATAAAIPNAMLGPQTLVLCQMEVPPAENAALLRRARAAGSPTMLNLAPAAPLEPALFALLDILVANEAEARSLGPDPTAIAAQLRQAFIVTRGADGSVAFLAGGGRIDVPAPPIIPVDTTGAGDTFTGVLAASLDEPHLDGQPPLAMALRRANTAAGLACLAHGAQTAMPDRAAVDAAMPDGG